MFDSTDYLVRYGVSNAVVAELLTLAVDTLSSEIYELEHYLCELERDGESRERRLVEARRHALLHERSVLAAEADRTTDVVASVFGNGPVKRGEVRAAVYSSIDDLLQDTPAW